MKPKELMRGRRRFVIAVLAVVVAASAMTIFLAVPMIGLVAVAIAAVVIAKWAAPVPILAIVATNLLVSLAFAIPHLSESSVIAAVMNGLFVSLCVALPALITDVIRQRRAFSQRGWALADTAASGRTEAVETALQRERMAIAADMHDGLGHKLTLLAVQLGQLELSEELPEALRAPLERARATASDAVDELGTSVALLRHPVETPVAPITIAGVLAATRAAGVEIEDAIPAELETTIGAETHAAIARVLQEGLTNAAKHAPGTRVEVDMTTDRETVQLSVRNRMTVKRAFASRGFGLIGLRQRVSVLGGTFTAGPEGDDFLLRADLAAHARPSAPAQGATEEFVAAEQEDAVRNRARATRSMIAVPGAILGVIAIVSAGFFVLANVLSVLPADDFEKITAGTERSFAETVLPAWEMLEPPRDIVPAREGEECRYYESEVSFFERVDVYVICFTNDRVSRTESVPAP